MRWLLRRLPRVASGALGGPPPPRTGIGISTCTLGVHGNGSRQATPDSGRAQSHDAALPDIRQAMERYLAFIGPEGWATHVEHMRRIG